MKKRETATINFDPQSDCLAVQKRAGKCNGLHLDETKMLVTGYKPPGEPSVPSVPNIKSGDKEGGSKRQSATICKRSQVLAVLIENGLTLRRTG